MTHSSKCTASRADGRPCRAWARRNSDPSRCNVHARSGDRSAAVLGTPAEPGAHGDVRDGFYDGRFTLQEIADLVTKNAGDDLTDEVAAARVAVRRTLQHLEEALTPGEFAHLAQIIFTGTNTIVRLLQAQQDLADPHADRFYQAIGQALDEMSGEKKTKL
jgi:hypothetical protein